MLWISLFNYKIHISNKQSLKYAWCKKSKWVNWFEINPNFNRDFKFYFANGLKSTIKLLS